MKYQRLFLAIFALFFILGTTQSQNRQSQQARNINPNTRLQNRNIKPQTSNVRPQTPNVRPQNPNVRPQNPNVRPPQTIQKLPPGHKNILPPKKGEPEVKPGILAMEAPSDLYALASKMTYKSVTLDQVNRVFSKRDWALRLTDCIVNVGYCNIPFGLDLFRRIDAASKGGPLCPGCTRAEAINQLQAIVRTVSIYQNYYPQQWKRIEKKLLFLDSRI